MPPVIVLTDDLMAVSRVREAAGPDQEVRSAPDAGRLLAAVRAGARLVLVDADSNRVDWRSALDALRADATSPRPRVVAFLSHVEAGRAEDARTAGADRVLARSALARALPDLLAAARDVSEENTP